MYNGCPPRPCPPAPTPRMALRAPNCLPLDHGQTRGGIFGEGIFDGPALQSVPQACTPRRPVPTNQRYDQQVGFQPSPYARPVTVPGYCPPPCAPRCPPELMPRPVTPAPQPDRPRPIPPTPGDVPDDRRPTPVTPERPPQVVIPSIPGIPPRPIIPTPGRVPPPRRVPIDGGSSTVTATTTRRDCPVGSHWNPSTGRCEPDKFHGYGHYAQNSGIFGTPNCGNGAGVPYAPSPYADPVTVPGYCPPPQCAPRPCPPNGNGLPFPLVPRPRPCPPQAAPRPCPPRPPFPVVPDTRNDGTCGLGFFGGFGGPDGLMGIR